MVVQHHFHRIYHVRAKGLPCLICVFVVATLMNWLCVEDENILTDESHDWKSAGHQSVCLSKWSSADCYWRKFNQQHIQYCVHLKVQYKHIYQQRSLSVNCMNKCITIKMVFPRAWSLAHYCLLSIFQNWLPQTLYSITDFCLSFIHSFIHF